MPRSLNCTEYRPSCRRCSGPAVVEHMYHAAPRCTYHCSPNTNHRAPLASTGTPRRRARAGYSGPAVLDLSHHIVRSLDGETPGKPPRLAVRWSELTVDDWAAELRAPSNGGVAVGSVVRRHLPNRLAVSLLEGVVDSCKPCGSLSKGEAAQVTERLAAYNLPVSGHQGCASGSANDVPETHILC